MTFWIVLGAIGVFLWIAAFVGVIALCIAAEELPDPDPGRDEQATSATLYPTNGRNVHVTVVNLMPTGLSADAAVARIRDTSR